MLQQTDPCERRWPRALGVVGVGVGAIITITITIIVIIIVVVIIIVMVISTISISIALIINKDDDDDDRHHHHRHRRRQNHMLWSAIPLLYPTIPYAVAAHTLCCTRSCPTLWYRIPYVVPHHTPCWQTHNISYVRPIATHFRKQYCHFLTFTSVYLRKMS